MPTLMTDLASKNCNLALKVAEQIQSQEVPGIPWCSLHTCLGWDRDLSVFHEELERAIGEEKLKAALHMISNKSKAKDNFSAQARDLVLKYFLFGKFFKTLKQLWTILWVWGKQR
jgi:hypothetical protein